MVTIAPIRMVMTGGMVDGIVLTTSYNMGLSENVGYIPNEIAI